MAACLFSKQKQEKIKGNLINGQEQYKR